MKARFVIALGLPFVALGLAFSAETPYRAHKGDTLWDLARKHWKDPWAWPELWSLNPHLRNPHVVDKGDPIFFRRGKGVGDSIRLPVALPEEAVAGVPAAPPPEPGPSRPAPAFVGVPRNSSGDFVSSHRLARLGTVANRHLAKNIYSEAEDVEFDLEPGSDVKVGDLVTVFTDADLVKHPVNGEPQGYLVRVLGHVRVRSVAGGNGHGHVVESYDPVFDGAGLMAYRAPITRVEPRPTKMGVEGVVLDGAAERSLFTTEDVVFLDRGSLHGLEPGAVLDVPIQEKLRDAAGLVDLERPMARLVVVSVEDKTATGLIVASRGSVMRGDRFVATVLSP